MSTEIKSLQQVLIEELGKQPIERTPVPTTIVNNLNPQFSIRPYQERAFKLFTNYWENAFEGKPRANHQLLFHMATGSGKTLVMAGLIAYLYSQGYRNFLFFVNSTNIINKTRDNFFNEQSKKYLFTNEINIGDRRIAVREVSNFQYGNPDDINIVFSTIQGLHMALNTPSENSMTYDDFENQNIVLISDEAHHINADTKKGKDTSTEGLFESVSWESTVERIFRANAKNVLLEFTATVDFNDTALNAKYKPKLIFDYPLKQFRLDGYSKEIKVLEADLPQFDRALQAVLLSQYRRKIFEKNYIQMKPVVMFKSKTIKDSQAFYREFIEGIKGLKSETLQAIRHKSSDEKILKIFEYMDAHRITLDNLIIELKEDFSEDKLIEVNSKEESEAKQIAVNSLESNEYRAVFAVDKLNEGWDVLNLFDIVRLYNTRDSKGNKVGKTTMQEAQLIGRGARYCPFQTSPEQPMDGRKFDSDTDNELRICEELYYHSAYNPKYIQELNSALREIGMKSDETRERKLVLKDSFKQTKLYKAGHVFLNKQVKYSRDDVIGLDSSLIQKLYKVSLHTGYSKNIIAFDEPQKNNDVSKSSKDFLLVNFGLAVVYKAIQRLNFYEFAHLKKYLPHLESIEQLILKPEYLGKIRVEVTGLPEQIKNLTQEDKLSIAIDVLSEISTMISSDKIEYKGSKEFYPHMINAVFTDKSLSFMLDTGGDKEFGRSMIDSTETAYYLDLSAKPWYVFNDCYGTDQEKLLIKFIDKKYTDLQKLYSEVYLLRNENHFKLYSFNDGRACEPDFLLYLVGKEKAQNKHYQIFIEPKGGHLLNGDAWKEDFLMSIKESHKLEQLFSSKHYIVWGMPFFNEQLRQNDFDNSFNDVLIEN